MEIFLTTLILSDFWLAIFLLVLPKNKKKDYPLQPYFRFIGDKWEE